MIVDSTGFAGAVVFAGSGFGYGGGFYLRYYREDYVSDYGGSISAPHPRGLAIIKPIHPQTRYISTGVRGGTRCCGARMHVTIGDSFLALQLR